jgi:hypothetical protein
MTKDQIKKCMLDAVGNPGVGSVYQAADKMAEAVYECLNSEGKEVKESKKADKVEKEIRITESEETR